MIYIPSYILKERCESLCSQLLFSESHLILVATIPQDWKTANLMPTFKKQKENNYRPISLLFQASKILESIIRDAMTKVSYWK